MITDISGSTIFDDSGSLWSSSAQFSLAIMCGLAGFGFEIKKAKGSGHHQQGIGR